VTYFRKGLDPEIQTRILRADDDVDAHDVVQLDRDELGGLWVLGPSRADAYRVGMLRPVAAMARAVGYLPFRWLETAHPGEGTVAQVLAQVTEHERRLTAGIRIGRAMPMPWRARRPDRVGGWVLRRTVLYRQPRTLECDVRAPLRLPEDTRGTDELPLLELQARRYDAIWTITVYGGRAGDLAPQAVGGLTTGRTEYPGAGRDAIAAAGRWVLDCLPPDLDGLVTYDEGRESADFAAGRVTLVPRRRPVTGPPESSP
jgi:hypothetical protein